jgi:hypothetical protein
VAAVQVRRRDAEADRALVREREAAVRAEVVPFVVHDEAARAPHYFFSIESLPKICCRLFWALGGRGVGAQDFFRLFFLQKTPFLFFGFLENRIPLGHIFGPKKYSSTKFC